MTRKKYMKLLMARPGWDRNVAQTAVYQVRFRIRIRDVNHKHPFMGLRDWPDWYGYQAAYDRKVEPIWADDLGYETGYVTGDGARGRDNNKQPDGLYKHRRRHRHGRNREITL